MCLSQRHPPTPRPPRLFSRPPRQYPPGTAARCTSAPRHPSARRCGHSAAQTPPKTPKTCIQASTVRSAAPTHDISSLTRAAFPAPFESQRHLGATPSPPSFSPAEHRYFGVDLLRYCFGPCGSNRNMPRMQHSISNAMVGPKESIILEPIQCRDISFRWAST